MMMIHTTGARECPRRYVSRTRQSTEEWYKQENQKCRVQVSRSPGAVPYPLEHGRIRVFVVLMGNLQGFLLQRRACFPL